ncbi:hypothetical protein AAFF_G00078620 [Aldrovandia affinis]|uniref:Uncharacterized protein n=1 Tax=Aldrovandia affinis TaxID=143900 RepID=A0AAD7RX72_9TELE|nr:hypothetical protein AAFF_G00078620 [Aldrovandia affinis]
MPCRHGGAIDELLIFHNPRGSETTCCLSVMETVLQKHSPAVSTGSSLVSQGSEPGGKMSLPNPGGWALLHIIRRRGSLGRRQRVTPPPHYHSRRIPGRYWMIYYLFASPNPAIHPQSLFQFSGT